MNSLELSLKPFGLVLAWLLLGVLALTSTPTAQSADGPAGATPSDASRAQTRTVKPAELDEWLKGSKDIVVLDVRTPEERKEGHIAKSINVDAKASDFKEQLGKLDREKIYVVHCVRGLKRTTDSVAALRELGFKRVISLEGGYKAWTEQGRPVTK